MTLSDTNSNPGRTVLMAMRLPFLLLVFSSLSLPLGVAYYLGFSTDWGRWGLCLAAALLAHIAVNMLNEYEDFQSGLDLETERTPFSGGSSALLLSPNHAQYVRVVGIGALVGACVIGLGLLAGQPEVRMPVLFLGLIGVCLVILYTRWLTRSPWFCLVAPGLAFGPVMVTGVFMLTTGGFSGVVLVLSLVPFCLTNNLLLINQFPDYAVDKKYGRRHLLIEYGPRVASYCFALQAIVAAAIVPGLAIAGWLPAWLSVIVLAYLPLWSVFKQARQFRVTHSDFVKAMAINVQITLLVPVFLTVMLCVAA